MKRFFFPPFLGSFHTIICVRTINHLWRPHSLVNSLLFSFCLGYNITTSMYQDYYYISIGIFLFSPTICSMRCFHWEKKTFLFDCSNICTYLWEFWTFSFCVCYFLDLEKIYFIAFMWRFLVYLCDTCEYLIKFLKVPRYIYHIYSSLSLLPQIFSWLISIYQFIFISLPYWSFSKWYVRIKFNSMARRRKKSSRFSTSGGVKEWRRKFIKNSSLSLWWYNKSLFMDVE